MAADTNRNKEAAMNTEITFLSDTRRVDHDH
jgi:hypothetical protein